MMGNNKKAQIGSTITWVAGFLVILFIIILFIGGAVTIAGIKKVGEFSFLNLIKAQKPAGISALSGANIFYTLLNHKDVINKQEISFVEVLEKNKIGDFSANDMECFLRRALEDYEQKEIFTEIFLDDNLIKKTFGKECVPFSESKFLLYSKMTKETNILKFVLYSCEQAEKDSYTLFQLSDWLYLLQSSGRAYDKECRSIDELTKIVSSQKETEIQITDEQKKMIEQMLTDRTEILAGEIKCLYDGNTGLWRIYMSSDNFYVVKEEDMVKNFASWVNLDLLNAKKQEGKWIIPVK